MGFEKLVHREMAQAESETRSLHFKPLNTVI